MTNHPSANRSLSDQDHAALAQAARTLATPGKLIQAFNVLGRPIELAIEKLPEQARQIIERGTSLALEKSLDLAIHSLDRVADTPSWLERAAATTSGAVGGATGWAGLAVELPISTTFILRGVARVARAEGENLSDIEARLACLQVFALGGTSTADDGAETGYFAIRAGLTKAVVDAARHIAEKGLERKGAPALARFIAKIAARYSSPASEKLALQAVPVIGAVTGAAINYTFASHFEQMAAGHFTIRRLERAYGEETIRRALKALGQAEAA